MVTSAPVTSSVLDDVSHGHHRFILFQHDHFTTSYSPPEIKIIQQINIFTDSTPERKAQLNQQSRRLIFSPKNPTTRHIMSALKNSAVIHIHTALITLNFITTNLPVGPFLNRLNQNSDETGESRSYQCKQKTIVQ